MKLTKVGGPTVLIEFAGWRLLVDPTFDPAGTRHYFPFGLSSLKTRGPLFQPSELGAIDVVLLSHDDHPDNLDESGREVLRIADVVITTVAAQRRLALKNVVGLRPDESVMLSGSGRPDIEVSATAAYHGPFLTRMFTGRVLGFTVRRAEESRAAVWLTGDTIVTRPLLRRARTLNATVLVVNAGQAGFSRLGQVKFTMNGSDAAELAAVLEPEAVVPVHMDGWSHFRESEEVLRKSVAAAPPAVGLLFRWFDADSVIEI